MRVSISLFLAHVSAAAPIYSLDPNWPLPFDLNVSRITATAVVFSNQGQLEEVHVAQRGLDAPPVLVFSIDGSLKRTWGAHNISSIHGLRAQHSHTGGADTLWVADAGDFTVKQFSQAGGILRSVGTPGVPGGGLAPAQFSSPADITITVTGDIIVSDGDGGTNNRILSLSGADLSVEYAVGSNGTGPGQFQSPHSVDVALTAGQLWVANRGDKRLDAFASFSGKFLGSWGQECYPGFVPWGVRIDVNRDHMIVSDGTNARLYVFNASVNYPGIGPCQPPLQNLSVTNACGSPHELSIAPVSGDVFLACVGTPTAVQRYVLV